MVGLTLWRHSATMSEVCWEPVRLHTRHLRLTQWCASSTSSGTQGRFCSHDQKLTSSEKASCDELCMHEDSPVSKGKHCLSQCMQMDAITRFAKQVQSTGQLQLTTLTTLSRMSTQTVLLHASPAPMYIPRSRCRTCPSCSHSRTHSRL